MDIGELVEIMIQENEFAPVMNNPLAQFGPDDRRRYLGATLMPEQNVYANEYKEKFIKWRTVIAQHGTRYSPPAKRGGTIIGSMFVELSESDTATDIDAAVIDEVIKLIQHITGIDSLAEVPLRARLLVLKWVDQLLNRPLVELNEKMRWDCLVDAVIEQEGLDNYTGETPYPNPAGHRFSAASWSDNTVDPFADIQAGQQILINKGYRLNRIIYTHDVKMILENNTKMLTRAGITNIQPTMVVGVPGVLDDAGLARVFNNSNWPVPEEYNLQYQKEGASTDYFLKRGTMLLVGDTDRDVELLGPDSNPLVGEDRNAIQIPGTIGYTAIGIPTNQTIPGRAVYVDSPGGKAAPVNGQSWQTSLPVLLHPEGIVVIKDIE